LSNASWDKPFEQFGDKVAKGWVEAFLYVLQRQQLKRGSRKGIKWLILVRMCLSLAIFSYAGIENIAISVVEARWHSPQSRGQGSGQDSSQRQASEGPTSTARTDTPEQIGENAAQENVKMAMRATAVVLPILVASAYILTGLFVSLGLERDNCSLQRFSWLEGETCEKPEKGKKHFTFSPYILIAEASTMKGLNDAFNAFVFFTALTYANTNLNVASRTLFGMTRSIRSRHRIPNALAWLVKQLPTECRCGQWVSPCSLSSGYLFSKARTVLLLARVLANLLSSWHRWDPSVSLLSGLVYVWHMPYIITGQP